MEGRSTPIASTRHFLSLTAPARARTSRSWPHTRGSTTPLALPTPTMAGPPATTLHFAVRNPARPSAVADVLSVPAAASVGDVKAALATQYEGAPPPSSQTVRALEARRSGRGGRGVVGWRTGREGKRAGRARNRMGRALSFFVCFPHAPTPPSQLIYAGRVLKDDALPMVDVLGPMVSVCVRVWAVRVRGGAGVGFFFVLLPPPFSTSLSPSPSTLLLSGRRARPARPAPGHQGSSRAAATPTPAGRRV